MQIIQVVDERQGEDALEEVFCSTECHQVCYNFRGQQSVELRVLAPNSKVELSTQNYLK